MSIGIPVVGGFLLRLSPCIVAAVCFRLVGLKLFLSEGRECEVTTKKKHCKEVSENIC
jgi:hypothetical protein